MIIAENGAEKQARRLAAVGALDEPACRCAFEERAQELVDKARPVFQENGAESERALRFGNDDAEDAQAVAAVHGAEQA